MKNNNIEKIIKKINNNNFDKNMSNAYYDEILKNVKEIKSRYKKKEKKQKNINKLYNEGKKFTPQNIYLPTWVKDNLDEFRLISKNTIMDKQGNKYQINNSLNDLNGAEWTFFRGRFI